MWRRHFIDSRRQIPFSWYEPVTNTLPFVEKLTHVTGPRWSVKNLITSPVFQISNKSHGIIAYNNEVAGHLRVPIDGIRLRFHGNAPRDNVGSRIVNDNWTIDNACEK